MVPSTQPVSSSTALTISASRAIISKKVPPVVALKCERTTFQRGERGPPRDAMEPLRSRPRDVRPLRSPPRDMGPPAVVARSPSLWPPVSAAQSGSSSDARSTRFAVEFTAFWMSSSDGFSDTDGTASSTSTSNSGRSCMSELPGRRARRAFMAASEARVAARMAM